MTKAQRVRFKNLQKEYEAWGEVYAIVQYATNFTRRDPTKRGTYSGICHILMDLRYFDGANCIPWEIYYTMVQRVKDAGVGHSGPYWLATPGARRPRLKWIEEIMTQVKAEAHGP